MSGDVYEIRSLPQLPEGALLGEVIVITSFTQIDGTQGYAYRCEGDALNSTFVGLLEMVKHSLLTRDADPE